MKIRSFVRSGTPDENVATTVVVVRAMLWSGCVEIVAQPAGVQRVRFTFLPANERAAMTTARKRSRPTFSSVMRGRMLTDELVLVASSYCARNVVFACGCTCRLQAPPVVVV